MLSPPKPEDWLRQTGKPSHALEFLYLQANTVPTHSQQSFSLRLEEQQLGKEKTGLGENGSFLKKNVLSYFKSWLHVFFKKYVPEHSFLHLWLRVHIYDS